MLGNLDLSLSIVTNGPAVQRDAEALKGFFQNYASASGMHPHEIVKVFVKDLCEGIHDLLIQ